MARSHPCLETIEIQFSAAHFYRVNQWGKDRNLAEFGRCFSDYGHGHDYTLRVSFVHHEQLGPEVRTVLRLALKQIHSEFDHTHLNFALPYFQDRVPTTENVLSVLMERLQSALDPSVFQRVCGAELRETPEIGAAWGKTPATALKSYELRSQLSGSPAIYQSITYDCCLRSGAPMRVTQWLLLENKNHVTQFVQLASECESAEETFGRLNTELGVILLKVETPEVRWLWVDP